jgi:hypothetical protein
MAGFMIMMMMFGVFAAVMMAEASAASKRQQLFDRFAQRSGGRFLPAGTFSSRHRVMLVHRNHAVEVRQTSTGGKHPVFFVEATMALGGINTGGLRCEVYPESFMSSLGKLIGMQDLEIGHSVFDTRYILKSNDHQGLTSLLDQPVRDAVDSIYMMFSDRDVYVHVDRDRVLVKRRRLVREEGELDLFFAQVLRIFDGALRTLGALYQLPVDSAGIRFLGGEAAAGTVVQASAPGEVTFLPDSEGIHFEGQEPVALPPPKTCPVCGDALKGRLVVACASCDARHHRDCWEFNGSCSTYGCLSTMATES